MIIMQKAAVHGRLMCQISGHVSSVYPTNLKSDEFTIVRYAFLEK